MTTVALTVAIVTPWYRHEDLWVDYRAATLGRRDGDELIVVDNGTDPPLPFGTVRLEENRGFCGGSNAGLAAAETDAVLFLNNDVVMTETDWLDRIRDALEPGVLVGARLRSDAHATVDGLVMPYLDGWCLAGTRDDLLDLRGFDEGLTEPAYFSDNLLCLEARAAGMKLRQVNVGLIHKENATAEQGPPVWLATATNREIYLARARELLQVAA